MPGFANIQPYLSGLLRTATAVKQTPEATIRSYLVEHGSVQVRAEALLSTWGVPDFNRMTRRRIARALSRAGVEVEPPMSQVSRGSEVTLWVAPEAQAEPAAGAESAKEETRPWGERVAERTLTPLRRRPLRKRLGLDSVTEAPASASEPCAVCQAPATADSPAELLEGGWSLSRGLALCPDCREQGWELPEAGPFPFKRRSPRGQ
jgi:hypothetical protein